MTRLRLSPAKSTSRLHRGARAAVLFAGLALGACGTLENQTLVPLGSVERLRGMAESGDPAAMTALAQRYETGDGVELDLDKAIDWYRRAAAGDDAISQYQLGQMYLNGGIQPADSGRAAELFMRAAAHGHAGAQAALARLYERGDGVPQDYRRAAQFYTLAAMRLAEDGGLWSGRLGRQATPESVRWYERAARLGVAEAQYDLARAYELGHGTVQNLMQAEFWYREAATQGHDRAAEALARLYANGLTPTPTEAYAARDLSEPQAPAPRLTPPGPAVQVSQLPPANGYVLHLASYRRVEDADRGWAEMLEGHGDLLQGLELSIRRVEIPERGTFFRIHAGPVAERADALALCNRLNSRGTYCQPLPAGS
jgi:hypothetical protein